MFKFHGAVLISAIAFLVSLPCRADLLLGTQLTGTLQILSSPNLYNPTTQILNNGTTTFSFSIPTVNTVTTQVNITAQGDTLTLTEQVLTAQPGYAWTQTFTDAVFPNFNPVLVSSTFTGLTVSQTPNTMSFSWAGTGAVTQPTTFSAVFNLVDPPPKQQTPSLTTEAPAWLMLAAGLAAAVWFAGKRKPALGGPATLR